MLSSNTCGRSVGTSKDNRALELSRTHVVRFGSAVDDVIDGLHGKVPRHELANGSESSQSCADGNSGKSVFGDGSVNDTMGSKLCQQSLGHLVRTVVLRHFFAHQQHRRISRHFLGQALKEQNRFTKDKTKKRKGKEKKKKKKKKKKGVKCRKSDVQEQISQTKGSTRAHLTQSIASSQLQKTTKTLKKKIFF